MNKIEIREAHVEDTETILRFITELAKYEKLESEVKTSISDIESSLFSQESTAHAIICEVNGKPIGFAVFFYNYSTWLGKNGLYLEDLYVSPEYRSIGAGKAILKYLAQLAVSKKCGRFEWCVLDWNEPAIEFYKSIGAKPQNEWVIYRLTGDELKAFAG
ncbi:GNAT family N-acetyltransferase [Vibrio atypicus]|uniref:GNAT family N-acetyltransferase n=1 Tax=Vibrio atypicus TaxID=558271 RepID=UPI0013577281|nr:GNAT family N-acetyltransferase [Vibrio atypicus]